MARKKLTKKQEQTLDAMKERRVKDSTNLRTIIEIKLKWAQNEQLKGLETIKRQLQQVQDNKETLLKIEGIITVLNQLLEPIIEESKYENKKD